MINLSRGAGYILHINKIRTKKILTVLFLLLFPLYGQALGQLDAVINEIAWMGSEVESVEQKNWWRYEWVELYNNTDGLILIDGWRIELYREKLDWTLPLSGIIYPKSYFIAVSSDKICPEYDLNYSNLGGKFYNGGQKILLKDSNENIIDEIDCASGWFAGDNGTKQTMERKNPLLGGSTFANWETSESPGGTPRKGNGADIQAGFSLSATTTIVDNAAETANASSFTEKKEPPEKILEIFPSGIIFNEILPSPDGQDEKNEWIEILNQNDFKIDLSLWKISDTDGQTANYSFPENTIIGPQGFLLLYRSESKITLNNDSDGLKLIQPDGNISDSANYKNSPRNNSYNRAAGGSWFWSDVLSPGSANTDSSESQSKSAPDAADASKKNTADKTGAAENQMAAIGKFSEKDRGFPLAIFIALSAAIFSALAILILKRIAVK